MCKVPCSDKWMFCRGPHSSLLPHRGRRSRGWGAATCIHYQYKDTPHRYIVVYGDCTESIKAIIPKSILQYSRNTPRDIKLSLSWQEQSKEQRTISCYRPFKKGLCTSPPLPTHLLLTEAASPPLPTHLLLTVAAPPPLPTHLLTVTAPPPLPTHFYSQ